MFNHITSTQIGFQLSYGASDIRLQTELGMECTGYPVLYYSVYQTGIQTFQPEIRANPAKYRMQMFLMPNSVYCWKLINQPVREIFTASEELLDKKKRRSFVKPLPASSKSALSIVGNRLGLAAQPATKAPGRNAKSMVLVRSSSVPKPVELRLFSVAQLPNQSQLKKKKYLYRLYYPSRIDQK